MALMEAETQLQETKPFLGSAKSNPIIIIDDDDDDDDDATFTEKFQIEQVLRYSMISAPSSSSSCTLPIEDTENLVIDDDADEPDLQSVPSLQFYCGICMETRFITRRFTVAACGHAFCDRCIAQYVAAKLDDNVVSVGCPDPACKGVGTVELAACRGTIPADLLDRWGVALCEAVVGLKKFYCPFNDCSAMLIDDDGGGVTQAECPHCNRMFCARCRSPWHDGISCEDFQRLGKDERGREDLMLRNIAEKSQWQRCPRCKMYVERVTGCVHIVCR